MQVGIVWSGGFQRDHQFADADRAAFHASDLGSRAPESECAYSRGPRGADKRALSLPSDLRSDS